MNAPRLSRRQLVAAGAAAGAALGLRGTAVQAKSGWASVLDFTALPAGDGWPGWACTGVATLRRDGRSGLLEAGTDVFPCDPRPVAFAVDQRLADAEIEADVVAAGAGTGVVLRRAGPRDYYAAIYDDEQRALVLLRRSGSQLQELARAPVVRTGGGVRLLFSVRGTHPTLLTATCTPSGGAAVTVTARDSTARLQGPGDPGVLATARTLFPSSGPAAEPALGNIRLLPYGVQEGQAFLATPAGQQIVGQIRERSTAVFNVIAVRSPSRPAPTAPSVVAAGTGAPLARGAVLRVASDVPARVEIEIASNARFRHSRRVRAGTTGAFDAALTDIERLPAGRRVWWRARLTRRGRTTVGPARSFRVLPPAGSAGRARIAIGACASSFGPVFGHIAARRPDVFVWQGDLNYPDTMGPLAQAVPAYGGIWRDFLANPGMEDILASTLFAGQRDDHDYGMQDANSANLVPWGLAPWEAIMERRLYYRFSAGFADVWVLDQRRHKSGPEAPDTLDKTLLGAEQRAWLLRTLAASRAPFKVICSPCTLAGVGANGRDGSWAAGFTKERDLLLEAVRTRVTGRTIFVTGDTHWTMAYERDGLFEVRPCPLSIPTPNDITLTSPNAAEDARKQEGVLYADDERGHVVFLEVGAADGVARLDLTLEREDGAVVLRRRFEEPRPPARRRRRARSGGGRGGSRRTRRRA